MSATTMAPGGPGVCLLVLAVALTQGPLTKGALARGALAVPGDQPPEAVPVIHLHHGKASVDEYLRMIPDTLLASNKRVKPIDVRKIEHEDFIDYEIEFVELPNDEAETEEFIIKKTDVSDSSHNVLNTEDNKIPDDPLSDDTSSREGSSSSGRRAGDSKEVNLVNFSDLFRRARTKSRSRVASVASAAAASSDIRRRRRIKLKRDPSGGRGLGGSRDRGDASSEARNHIDTAQPPIKREHGSSLSHTIFSKSRTRSKSRNLIRDIPETDRKGTILDRRTTRPLQRHAGFRARKRQRVPLKFGRSFGHDDRPGDQLIRLRNPDIIAKLERSANNERNVMKSRDKSGDDLYDGMSMQQPEDTAHVRLELTTQTQATFPILTTPPPDTAPVNNNNKPAPNISTTSDAVKTAAENNDLVDLQPAVNGDEESELTRRVNMSSPPPAPSITTTTTATAPTTKSGAEAEANERGGERVSLQRTTPQPGQSTTPATTATSTTAAGLMMYPEVFSVAAPVTSVPVSLLSVFGPHQPRSSRLQVGPSNSNNNSNNSPQVSWSSSRSAVVSRHRPAPAPPIVSVFSPPTSTSTSTISSGLQFSIISTSTETRGPELDTSTRATSEATTITLATATTAVSSSSSSRQQQVSSTTTRPSSSSTTTTTTADRDDTTDKSSLQNEFKFGLVTTAGSITSDNPMMTTSIPEDLQLSESITSVYLHNSSTAPAVSNNIKTTETQPKKAPDSSITLLPFSKLTNQARDSSMESSPPPSSPVQKVGTPIQMVPTPVQPVQKVVPTTVQKVAKPVQKVARPIERVLAPEKKFATPIQKIASPDQPVQKVVQPVQKVVPPVQKVVAPVEKVETNNQKVTTPVQPVQKVVAPLQKAARPLQKVVQPVQKVAPPVQKAPRPVQEAVHVVTPATVMTYPEVAGSSTGGEYLEAHEGRYLEVNPGQYHEVNPGQYHEISPGQYHEVNPGQYDEVNPGQYQAAHEGQYQDLEPAYPRPGDYEVNEVKVDFDNRDEHKIYNVQAKAGDFIIGEVGKIDVNNGQTVEGVRYTALEGEVDPLRIAEILNRYFGTRTS